MTGHIFEATDTLVDALGSFETLLFRNNETADELLISLFTHPKEIYRECYVFHGYNYFLYQAE